MVTITSSQTWVYFKDTDNFREMYALIQDHYLVFSAKKVGLEINNSSQIKLHLFKETKSSIGKKIAEYLKSL